MVLVHGGYQLAGLCRLPRVSLPCSVLRGTWLIDSGFAINAPGFVATLSDSITVPDGALRIYYLVSRSPIAHLNENSSSQRHENCHLLRLCGSADPQSWITGTGVSGLVYYICCRLSPPPGMNKQFYEIDESAHEPAPGVGGSTMNYGTHEVDAIASDSASAERSSSEDKDVYTANKVDKYRLNEKVSVAPA